MQTNVKKLKLVTILLCEQFNQMNVLKILAFDHLSSTMLVLIHPLSQVMEEWVKEVFIDACAF